MSEFRLKKDNILEKPEVIIITGPTASGKSDVAISLGCEIDGEIVSADSMQIYRGLDIGTAKVNREQQKIVPHHLIDICEPGDFFSVAAYKDAADKAIRDIISRGKRPIVCGGTGQYLSALLLGINYVPVNVDQALRSEFDRKARQNLPDLWRELQKIDPASAEKIAQGDKKRIVRALEVYYQTGITRSEHDRRSREKGPDYSFSAFCLTHDRPVLYARINQRVDKMLQQGLLQEAESLLKLDIPAKSTCLQAIGYKELIAFLHGEQSLESAVTQIKQSTRRYAKRQLTWFRKMNDLTWLENKNTRDACNEILQTLSIDN